MAQPNMTLWWVDEEHIATGGGQAIHYPCDTTHYYNFSVQDEEIIIEIKNEGDAPLTLTQPLTLTGASSAVYTIVTQPDKSVLQPNEETHFVVKYTSPFFYDSAQASLAIESNDPNNASCTLNFEVGIAIPGPVDPITIESALGVIVNLLELVIIPNTNDLSCVTQSTEVLSLGTTPFLQFETDNTIFDSNGNLTSSTTTYTLPPGIIGSSMEVVAIRTTSNIYDDMGNLVSSTFAFQDNSMNDIGAIVVTNVFNANCDITSRNRVATIGGFINLNDATTFTYDENGLLVSATSIVPGGLETEVIYNYDANGAITSKVTTIKDDSDNIIYIEIITNTFDANGNLLSAVTTFENAAGTVSSLRLNEAYTYDTNGRPITKNTALEITPTFIVPFYEAMITPCTEIPPSLKDPCNCEDPLNKIASNGAVSHFHDILTVQGMPGQQVVLQSGNTNFLDNSLAPIANSTLLGVIPASGELNIDFFHAPNASGAITLAIGGAVQPPFNISVCNLSLIHI